MTRLPFASRRARVVRRSVGFMVARTAAAVSSFWFDAGAKGVVLLMRVTAPFASSTFTHAAYGAMIAARSRVSAAPASGELKSEGTRRADHSGADAFGVADGGAGFAASNGRAPRMSAV